MMQEQKRSIKILISSEFSKPKIKEFRKDLYRIENKKILSTQKVEKIKKNLFEFKKYHDYYYIEYKGIR